MAELRQNGSCCIICILILLILLGKARLLVPGNDWAQGQDWRGELPLVLGDVLGSSACRQSSQALNPVTECARVQCSAGCETGQSPLRIVCFKLEHPVRHKPGREEDAFPSRLRALSHVHDVIIKFW